MAIINSLLESVGFSEIPEEMSWVGGAAATLAVGAALIYTLFECNRPRIQAQVPQPAAPKASPQPAAPKASPQLAAPKASRLALPKKTFQVASKAIPQGLGVPMNHLEDRLEPLVLPSSNRPCKFKEACSTRDPKHYRDFAHPTRCRFDQDCQSEHIGHLLGFEHTYGQVLHGLHANIKAPETGTVLELNFKNVLTHSDLDLLYNLTVKTNANNLTCGTALTKEFLKAAFFHSVYVASRQIAQMQHTTVQVKGPNGVENKKIIDLQKEGKIKFAFGPSHDAFVQFINRINTDQTTRTLAPFGNPENGFKWAEHTQLNGDQKFDKNEGLHLLTGCYHSTTNNYGNEIFKEVKMIGGGYLGKGMYFTVAPTNKAEADDLDAVLKTSTYGLFKGGVIVVGLVAGYDGVRYVNDSDKSQPNNGNWDLKYLHRGRKSANYANADEKNKGAAELVATHPTQVLPLGVIYIEDAYISPDEKASRETLLGHIASNANELDSK